MSAKKLDQSVFDGLPNEYRWAAVDRFGVCAAFTKMPVPAENGSGWRFDDGKMKTLWCSNERRLSYFTIERHDVPSAGCTGNPVDVPTADIDWIDGAAYWCNPFPPMQPSGFFINADFTQVHDGVSWVQALPQVNDLRDGTHSKHVVKRPESITDVARSIEAARVAEQSERTYPHYFKDVSDVDAIDLYHVARLYDITDPALFHAFKKIACAGKRGAKDQAQDVQEAIDAMKRWQELNV